MKFMEGEPAFRLALIGTTSQAHYVTSIMGTVHEAGSIKTIGKLQSRVTLQLSLTLSNQPTMHTL